MNQTHWHLIVNHFPVIGTIFSFILLATGIYLNKSDIKKASLGLFVLVGILTIPAYITGEGAEDVLETNGINAYNFVEAHEDLAAIALWTSLITAFFAAIAFFFESKKSSLSKIFIYSTLIISLGNMILLKSVATSGGEIRHTEIRTTTVAINTAQPPASSEQESKEKED
jgi:hypothetical protein